MLSTSYHGIANYVCLQTCWRKIHSNIDKVWGINVSNLYVLLKYLIYKVKQLESDYRLFNMLYRLLEF